MNKPVNLSDNRRAAKQFTDLASIFHPRWNSATDYMILQLRSQGRAFDLIAGDLQLQVRAVEQRWHRLRAVPQIERRLKAYGLTPRSYSMPGVDRDPAAELGRILTRVSNQSCVSKDRILGDRLDKPAVYARQDVMRYGADAGLTRREIAEFLGRGVNAINHGIHASRKRFEDRQAARV